jgi:hypothetical protein
MKIIGYIMIGIVWLIGAALSLATTVAVIWLILAGINYLNRH